MKQLLRRWQRLGPLKLSQVADRVCGRASDLPIVVTERPNQGRQSRPGCGLIASNANAAPHAQPRVRQASLWARHGRNPIRPKAAAAAQ